MLALAVLACTGPASAPVLHWSSLYAFLVLSALAMPAFTIALAQMQRQLPAAVVGHSLRMKLG